MQSNVTGQSSAEAVLKGHSVKTGGLYLTKQVSIIHFTYKIHDVVAELKQVLDASVGSLFAICYRGTERCTEQREQYVVATAGTLTPII